MLRIKLWIMQSQTSMRQDIGINCNNSLSTCTKRYKQPCPGGSGGWSIVLYALVGVLLRSHIVVSLSLSHSLSSSLFPSLPSSLSKINKRILRWGFFFKKGTNKEELWILFESKDRPQGGDSFNQGRKRWVGFHWKGQGPREHDQRPRRGVNSSHEANKSPVWLKLGAYGGGDGKWGWGGLRLNWAF